MGYQGRHTERLSHSPLPVDKFKRYPRRSLPGFWLMA